jgi:hypothetical protein
LGCPFIQPSAKDKIIFDEVIVAGDRVVTCGTFTAIHPGEFQGLPLTSKPISLSIMHIDRVESRKIVEHWSQGDAVGLMQQLGIVFLPGSKLLPHIFFKRRSIQAV